MKKFVFSLFLAALFLGAYPAHAAIDNAGAEQLKKEITDFLTWQTRISGYAGQGLQADGNITVTPKGNVYDVRVPDASLLLASGYKVHLGTVVFNFKPAAHDGWYLSMALPKHIEVLDAARAPAFDIAIGQQRFSAEWSAKLDMFPKIDLEYQDLRLTPKSPTGLTVHIDSIKNILDLNEGSDNLWAGTHSMDVSKVEVGFNEAPKVSLKIDHIQNRMNYEKMHLDSADAIRQAINDMTAQQKDAPTEAQIRSKVQDIFKALIKTPPTLSGNSEMTGIYMSMDKISPVAGQPAAPPTLVSIDKISSSVDASGIGEEKTSVNGKARLDKFNISGIPPAFLGIIPTEANFDISVKNFPSLEIMKIVDSVGEIHAAQLAAPDKPVDPKKADALKARVDALPQIFAGAQTSFVITSSYIHAPDAGADLESNIVANSASPLGMTGQITLRLSGLDEMVKKNQPAAKTDRLVAKYIATISALQMMGALEPGPDGKPVRKYQFELSPDGKMLLNGADVSTIGRLIGGGLAPTPAALAPAPQAAPAPAAPPAPVTP